MMQILYDDTAVRRDEVILFHVPQGQNPMRPI